MMWVPGVGSKGGTGSPQASLPLPRAGFPQDIQPVPQVFPRTRHVPEFSRLKLRVCHSGPEWGHEEGSSRELSLLSAAGRAARAQSRGCFRAEIVPVTTTIHDDKGTKRSITVSQDEGIRPNTTMEGLAKLKPAFKDGGSTTAGEHGPDPDWAMAGTGAATRHCHWASSSTVEPGVDQVPQQGRMGGQILLCLALMPPHPNTSSPGNSSQVSDGAAAILLARRSKAEELGLPILGVLRSYAVVGVPPDIMGIGPAYAIPAALEKAGQSSPSHPRPESPHVLLLGTGGGPVGAAE